MWAKLKTHLALLAVNLIYGANYSIAKIAMPDYIKPFGFIFIRVTMAGLILWLISLITVKEKIAKADFVRLAACGFFGVTFNMLLFFQGLNFTTPINAAIIMITAPILVFGLSAIFLKERITFMKSGGMILGAAGAFLLMFVGKEVSFSSTSFLGDLYVFINAMSYAIYLVTVKPLMKKYHPLTVIKWVFLFGAVGVIPVGWGDFAAIEWQTFTSKIWLVVLYVVLFTTVLAYVLNIFALRNVNPSVVGIYIYLQPVFATLVSILIYSEHPDYIQAVSALMIFAGVYLVSSKPVKSAKLV